MIKEVTLDNLNEIKLMDESFTNEVMNYDSIKKDLKANPFSKYIVYIINDKVLGLTNYLLIYEKVEISNIYVNPNFRRQQIASVMMNYIIKKAHEKGCDNITLEVRKSNLGAINLYKKLGFKKIGIRKNYYENEDGFLMEKKLVN